MLSIELTPQSATPRGRTRESTVSMRVVVELLDAASRSGVARDVLERATGVEPERLVDVDARLSRAALYAIFERVLDLTDDPAFGLHWAERLGDRALVPVALLLAHAASLRHAFALLARFSPLLADHTDYEVHEVGELVCLRCLPLEGASARTTRASAEMMTAGFLRLVRTFDDDAEPVHVTFAHEAPAHGAEYARIFGDGVRFGAAHTELAFSRALLGATSRAHDDDVREALEAVASRRLIRLGLETSYAVRARAFIVREGWPHRTDMKSVARALDLSVRTLRRRLEAEGRPYNDVLREALAQVAIDLVRDDRRTMKDIAFAMGFSDSTAFHRAFKRWTGTTPGAIRGGETT